MTHRPIRPGKRPKANRPTDAIPLEIRRPISSSVDVEEEEINPDYPDSDVILLHQYREVEDEDEASDSAPGILSVVLTRLPAFMSRTPLLSRSSFGSRASNYATLDPNAPIGVEDSSDDGNATRGDIPVDDVRRRDGKAKSTALRSASTSQHRASDPSRTGSSVSRHRRISRISRPSMCSLSRGIAVTAGDGGKCFESLAPGGFEDEDPGENVFEDDPDVSIWGDEDPPDNSPYPQVRASVSAVDNTSLSISTPRMWVLSILFALAGSATNLFFSLRYPSVAITPIIALVLVHPLGRLWDKLLKRDEDPLESFENGVLVGSVTQDSIIPRSRQWRLWLAQGRWNEKEHACVYISSNVSFGFAFATDVGNTFLTTFYRA